MAKDNNKVSQKHVSTVSWNAVESLVCFLKSAKAFSFPDGTLPRRRRGFQNGPACTCVCDLPVSSLRRGVHLHPSPQVSAMNSGPRVCSKTGLKTSLHCRSGASVTRNQHVHWNYLVGFSEPRHQKRVGKAWKFQPIHWHTWCCQELLAVLEGWTPGPVGTVTTDKVMSLIFVQPHKRFIYLNGEWKQTVTGKNKDCNVWITEPDSWHRSLKILTCMPHSDAFTVFSIKAAQTSAVKTPLQDEDILCAWVSNEAWTSFLWTTGINQVFKKGNECY